MAEKNTAVDYFKEIMFTRYGAKTFIQANAKLYTNIGGISIVCVPDHVLWEQLADDEYMKEFVREYDPVKDDPEILEILSYADDLETNLWIGLNSDDMYDGKIINININGLNYAIPIGKGLFPRLRKAEYNGFAYRVFFKNQKIILVLKKRWKAAGCGFTTLRGFAVL